MASHRHHAFTIVELLVVVLIIAILAGIVCAALKSARDSANRVTCASNLHQISVAIQSYAGDNSGEVPAVYGLSYAHGRPMAWCNIGMHKDGIACGGLLLLVTQPVGLASQGCFPDKSLYVCPGDALSPAHPEGSSYTYCYVPRGGGTYGPWYLQPQPKLPTDPSKYNWSDSLLAGLERHSVSIANAASTAILVEDTAQHPTGPTGKAWHRNHGAGGNILYLDGHVAYANMDLPFFHDTRQYVENLFSNADAAAGGM